MAIIFPEDFKDGMFEYMEGGLPPFVPLVLRVLGGAIVAITLIVFMPEVPIIFWVLGALLCFLPAFYCSVLSFGEKEKFLDAVSSIKRDYKGIGFWKGVGFLLLFILLCALRVIHWAIAYAFLGGIVFLISLAF